MISEIWLEMLMGLRNNNAINNNIINDNDVKVNDM